MNTNNQKDSRLFDIGDVLSITTGKLLSPRLIGGVYDILNYMTGDTVFTHQIRRASDACKPALLAQYPELEDIDASCVNPANYREWLDVQRKRLGDALAITPLADWQRMDAMGELEDLVGPDKIIPIVK